ncbi:MAG: Ppx/GppA phosphatase family protein [Thermoplasmatota archaeon]
MDARPFPLRVASVDVGSNGIRCVAAEFSDPDRYEVLLQERAAVRLGHSVFRDGAIDMASMEAAIEALGRFRAELDQLNVRHVRAVATSAVREATNQEPFLRRARKESKLGVEVIEGGEEARLVHLAVSRRLDLTTGPWMLMDLGGGSVEVTLVDKTGVRWSESHPMGSVRLLEEFHSLAGDVSRFQRLISETVATLRLPAAPRAGSVAGLAATGGNIEDLARLAGERDPETKVSEIPVKELARILVRLAELSPKDRMREFNLRPDRADVILPAGLVYERVAKLVGVDRIHVPHVGLKEGVLYDLVAGLAGRSGPRSHGEEVVRSGSFALGRRYRFEEEHGEHVARLALSLFDQTLGDHRLGDRDRAVLHAAALLHDVGRFIGDRKHHKHSYYLISEADIPGLTPPETDLAAQVARYHRRKEPTLEHAPFARLTEGDQARVVRLSALLRVADALDREHRQAVRAVTVRREGRKTVLAVQGEGEFELEDWAVRNKGGLYASTFGTTLEIRREGP